MGHPSANLARWARLAFGKCQPLDACSATLVVGLLGPVRDAHTAGMRLAGPEGFQAPIDLHSLVRPVLAVLILVVVCFVAVAGLRGVLNAHVPGMAARRAVEHSAGRRGLDARAAALRPGLTRAAKAQDLGYRIGSSCGVTCYSSVEDLSTALENWTVAALEK